MGKMGTDTLLLFCSLLFCYVYFISIHVLLLLFILPFHYPYLLLHSSTLFICLQYIYHAQPQSWAAFPTITPLYSVLSLQKAVTSKGVSVWGKVEGSYLGLFHLKGLRKIMKPPFKISDLQSTKYKPLSIGTYLFGM
jgi:hypothetical protein